MEGKYDFLTKVSDRRDIVDFVKEIEKYPCLYDKTLPEYANKVYNRRAWSTIAKKINTTIPDCRDKWRKIRISFMRSLKQQQSDKPPMRPYYLSEELHFLRPFLKINPLKTSPQKNEQKDEHKDEQMDYDICTGVQKQELSDSEASDPFEIECVEDERDNSRIVLKEANSVTKEKPNEVVYIKQSPRNSYNDQKSHGRRYSDEIESNPRKMFLLSLLPDVECFTEAEMRIFRRKVITVCDDIMNGHII